MFGMDQPLFKILNEIRFKEHAMMFMKPNASQDEIVKSGEDVIASLYGDAGDQFVLVGKSFPSKFSLVVADKHVYRGSFMLRM
jgi:hypothetical protein